MTISISVRRNINDVYYKSHKVDQNHLVSEISWQVSVRLDRFPEKVTISAIGFLQKSPFLIVFLGLSTS